MKAKLIGGVMMGMLLCVGVSNMAKAQPGCGRRGGVSFSLNIGAPIGVGYAAPAVAYCPPPPVAYCPPSPPVVYRRVYRRPHYNGYYNGGACNGYGVAVVNNYYSNGGHHNNGRYNQGGYGGYYQPRGHR